MANAGMMARVMVLGASRYKFAQEGTGEIIEGCKVHYVEAEGGQEENNVGQIPQTSILDYEFYEYISTKKLPALCDAEVTMSLRGRKPTLKVVNFKYVSAIELGKVADGGNKAAGQ